MTIVTIAYDKELDFYKKKLFQLLDNKERFSQGGAVIFKMYLRKLRVRNPYRPKKIIIKVN